jgi:hypothetical protein
MPVKRWVKERERDQLFEGGNALSCAVGPQTVSQREREKSKSDDDVKP